MAGRLAITGANGFVGRHLTAAATKQGWDVVGLVRSAEGARIVQASGGRPLILGSAEPPEDVLARALTGAQAAIHLAQIGSEKHGATYESVNVEGTRRLMAAARRADVPRVVLFSGLGVGRYGQSPRLTNRYFLSKLASELELLRSDREAVVFRPSYIVGPGDGLVRSLLRDLTTGEVELPGDGSYRLQPVAVQDAAASVLAALGAAPAASGRPPHRVFDLVGPEPLSYRALIDRVAQAARAQGRAGDYRVRTIPVEDADRQAHSGGYRGLWPDELDCLLCDEVADQAPLERLVGRRLTAIRDAIEAAVRGTPG